MSRILKRFFDGLTFKRSEMAEKGLIILKLKSELIYLKIKIKLKLASKQIFAKRLN